MYEKHLFKDYKIRSLVNAFF